MKRIIRGVGRRILKVIYVLPSLAYQLIKLRDLTYSRIAGEHPKTNLFHHQWAMNRSLLNFSVEQLSRLSSGDSIIDVGVGSAPYWYIRPDLNWTGIDIVHGANVSFVIDPNGNWPMKDSSFDHVFCTQVLEHVEEPSYLVAEIHRVLRPKGKVILNAPFLYPFHGMPDDQARYTTSQLQYLFKDFQIEEVGEVGRFGSSMATLILNFVNYKISQSLILQILKILLFPLWLCFNFMVNAFFTLLDLVDNTKSFPLNTYIVATKSEVSRTLNSTHN